MVVPLLHRETPRGQIRVSERKRRAYELRVVQERPLEEVARTLGVTPKKVSAWCTDVGHALRDEQNIRGVRAHGPTDPSTPPTRRSSPGTCTHADRDQPRMVCGYPLPCPWHTLTIEPASVTSPATVTKPVTADVGLLAEKRVEQIAVAIELAPAAPKSKKRRAVR